MIYRVAQAPKPIALPSQLRWPPAGSHRFSSLVATTSNLKTFAMSLWAIFCTFFAVGGLFVTPCFRKDGRNPRSTKSTSLSGTSAPIVEGQFGAHIDRQLHFSCNFSGNRSIGGRLLRTSYTTCVNIRMIDHAKTRRRSQQLHHLFRRRVRFRHLGHTYQPVAPHTPVRDPRAIETKRPPPFSEGRTNHALCKREASVTHPGA